MRPEPIRFVKLDSEHAQSDGKSVNRALPVLDPARGRDSWCGPKGAPPLGTRMVADICRLFPAFLVVNIATLQKFIDTIQCVT